MVSNKDNLDLDKLFETNPLTKELQKERLKKIVSEIPILKECAHEKYLSLWKYIEHEPEKFYKKQAYYDIFQFLEDLKSNDIQSLLLILNEFNNYSFFALTSLEDINSLNFHDTKVPDNEYELITLLDTYFHPSYLRLTEATYSNLIFPLSCYQRIKRSAKLEGFDLFQRVEELKKTTKYNYLTSPYCNTIRNAVAHGKITYKPPSTTIYHDKNVSLDMNSRRIIDFFDEMLDICNGLSLGLRLFYFTNLDFLEKYGIKIPFPVVIEELKAELNAPGWEIKRCFESKTIDNRSQSLIISQNTFLDPLKLNYYVFRSAFLAEKYAPGYERYFFRLISKYSLPGWAAFNGTELTKQRTQNNTKTADYSNVLEDNLIFFVPKLKVPKIFLKFSTLVSSFRIQLPLKIAEMKVALNPISLEIRDTMIHRNGFFSIVKGVVIVKIAQNSTLDDLIKENYELIIRNVIKSARKKARKIDVSRYLLIGYIHISVYSEDFRIRKLVNSGLIPELVCTIEKNRLKRIKQIEIFGGVAEKRGKSKIVWNKNYLNKDL